MSAAVANQHADGAFGSNDDPTVMCCFTAEMIDTLLRISYRANHTRSGKALNAFPDEQITLARHWLLSKQQASGQWGEDLWDTCEVLKALIAIGEPGDQASIDKGLAALRRGVDEGWPQPPTYWTGPGQLGNALEVFGLVSDLEYGNRVAKELLQMQDTRTGEFNGAVHSGRAPIEWHTACALIGLNSSEMVACDPEKIAHGIQWLIAAQASDGSWCPGQTQLTCYITRNAVIALAIAEGPKSPAARRGTDYLVARWVEASSGPATSETMMAASALARTHATDLYGSISFALLSDAAQMLEMYEGLATSSQESIAGLAREKSDLQHEISQLGLQLSTLPTRLVSAEDRLHLANQALEDWKHRYEELNSRLGTYALRLTSNQLAVAGTILGVFGIVLSIILAN